MVGLDAMEMRAILSDLGAQALTITRQLPGTYDPVAQSSSSVPSPETGTFHVAILPATDTGDNAFAPGTATTVRRRKLLIGGVDPDGEELEFEPDNGYSITIDGDKYTLEGVTAIAIDGIAAAYKAMAVG